MDSVVDILGGEVAIFLGLMIPFLGLLVPAVVLLLVSIPHRAHPAHTTAMPAALDTPVYSPAVAEQAPDAALPRELSWQAEALREADIFEGLTDDELVSVARLAESRRVMQGTRLVGAGSRGHHLFVVVSGELRLLSHPPAEHVVRKARSGETVPLAAIIDPPVVVTTVEAAADCEVLSIPRQPLIDLLEMNPMMGYQVYRAVARSFEHRYRQTLDHGGDTGTHETPDNQANR